ncbi:unnamed protein product [Allacma fusca]|uniref:DUF5641 domain-containing protein n=1 Tax=Allacma fusca TaxID=39272 RepID=A0A8J2LQL3_9HEXA|nr:unnamed protein product [Allacma fusca]
MIVAFTAPCGQASVSEINSLEDFTGISWSNQICDYFSNSETHRHWIWSVKPSTVPTFEELCDFLDQPCRAISESGTLKVKSSSSYHNNDRRVSSYHGAVDAKCRVCKSFLASFKRFISRRGLCSDIYSDCGSNFVGADKEIRRIYEFVRSADSGQRIQHFLSARSVTWHYNPPASPHFGSLWESGVRVVKGHLRRLIGSTSLNFEEYATLLAQAGTLVLLKDERLPPTEGKLGRIVQVHPGPDGLVRVATLKTESGELKKPIVKLCPLPLEQSPQPKSIVSPE